VYDGPVTEDGHEDTSEYWTYSVWVLPKIVADVVMHEPADPDAVKVSRVIEHWLSRKLVMVTLDPSSEPEPVEETSKYTVP